MCSNSQNIYKHFIDIITACMIMIFTYAGLSKLISQETFYKQVLKSPFIEDYARWIIWLIPLTELTIVLSLLFKSTRLAGYYAFVLLMILFTAYIAAILLSGKTLPCSCGGFIQQLSWHQHLVFNGCLIVFGLVAIRLHYKSGEI